MAKTPDAPMSPKSRLEGEYRSAQHEGSPVSFEAALAELEEIVATMEGGKLPLKESLAAYKRGAELLQYCQATLRDAQQQVQVLEKGVLKAFEPDGGGDAGADPS